MKFTIKKVSDLITDGILEHPMDGNHGEKHPKTSDYVKEGIPFILVPDLVDGKVDLDNCNFISEKQSKILRKGFSKTGDVLFTHKATIGKVAIVDTKEYPYIILTPQITYYRLKNSDVIDSKYLYYYFTSKPFQEHFKMFASSGGTRSYLGITAQEKLSIIYPEKDYQQGIVKILSTYDDLIENNNRRIALLEKAAHELYKEWFVRFRFPGYETAEFENGIPKGWIIKRIGDIARVKSGYAFKSEWWIDEGVSVIKIKDIQNNTIDFSDLSKVSEENSLYAKQFFVTEGDLLIAMTGATIGKLALVPYSSERLVVNQRVGKFFCGNDPILNVGFLYFSLQQDWIQELIAMIAGSNAAQPNISSFDIEKIKILYNNETVEHFNTIASQYLKQMLLLIRNNQNLTKQRDLLLPRLMSGKLEV